MTKQYLFGHVNEETAYVVQDYPWGFRLRTEQRHWIETSPKHGDRHVTQTKDPRTGKWCKPKKSTYYAVMVLYIDSDTGHLKSTAIHQSSTQAQADVFLSRVRSENLSQEQRNQIKRIVALDKTMKHFTFTCEASPYTPINLSKVMAGDPEETAKAEAEKARQEEHKQEQEKAMRQMNAIFSHYMSEK